MLRSSSFRFDSLSRLAPLPSSRPCVTLNASFSIESIPLHMRLLTLQSSAASSIRSKSWRGVLTATCLSSHLSFNSAFHSANRSARRLSASVMVLDLSLKPGAHGLDIDPCCEYPVVCGDWRPRLRTISFWLGVWWEYPFDLATARSMRLSLLALARSASSFRLLLAPVVVASRAIVAIYQASELCSLALGMPETAALVAEARQGCLPM
mmetsp:Transcript_60580/g.179575  ORF Transcript_60580/g.179575 Transcript_60580/m.179575 type:complete len:209 (+) Transcript_60580:1993-2619(+)